MIIKNELNLMAQTYGKATCLTVLVNVFPSPERGEVASAPLKPSAHYSVRVCVCVCAIVIVAH